ncbi:MAG: hypothetical protein KDC39_16130, partial [Actinobacteria bacterium]|nr:hypothetical protein [Actinomycetota bacterium]
EHRYRWGTTSECSATPTFACDMSAQKNLNSRRRSEGPQLVGATFEHATGGVMLPFAEVRSE